MMIIQDVIHVQLVIIQMMKQKDIVWIVELEVIQLQQDQHIV